MTNVKVYIIILSVISGGIYAQEHRDHLWKDRVVVIHGTSEEDEQVVKQLQILKTDETAMADLKLVIHVATVNEIQYHCTDEVVVTTREKPIYSPFKIELYGLDGGLKFTSEEIVPMSKFYEIINSMPMRKSELKQRNKG